MLFVSGYWRLSFLHVEPVMLPLNWALTFNFIFVVDTQHARRDKSACNVCITFSKLYKHVGDTFSVAWFVKYKTLTLIFVFQITVKPHAVQTSGNLLQLTADKNKFPGIIEFPENTNKYEHRLCMVILFVN